MRWSAPLAGVGLGVIAVASFYAGNEGPPSAQTPDSPPAQVSTAAAQALPSRPARDVQIPREPPPRLALHGVIYRGKDGARSRVLLSVEGQPEQAYGIGDLVARGWSVHAIEAQRVILSKGAELASIDIVAPVSSTAAAAPAAKRSAPAASRPLPGFVAGPRPAMSHAAAQERNRRFLNAVQGRVEASGPPSVEHPPR
jgi:hypothetical protein